LKVNILSETLNNLVDIGTLLWSIQLNTGVFTVCDIKSYFMYSMERLTWHSWVYTLHGLVN